MTVPATYVSVCPRQAVSANSHPALRRKGQMVFHRPDLMDRPLRAVLDFGSVPTAPGCARAWTRQILWEWRLAGLSDAAEVIVSELMTNAVLASRLEGCPFIRLILILDEGELAILVRDCCSGSPQPRDAGADDEDGRGLLLVEAMSSRSGWYPADDSAFGKVVWAVAHPSESTSGTTE